MKEQFDSKIIRRYYNGQYSFRDLKRIALWFKDVHYHDKLKSVFNEQWVDLDNEDSEGSEKNLSFIFERIKHQIAAKKTESGIGVKLLHTYSRIAAILLIPLLIYSVYSLTNQFISDQNKNTTWLEVVSPQGTRTHFKLPDGTKVCLNGEAHLYYPSNFKDNRHVKLDGEAYFDVFHNASSPFSVLANSINITALGTKFSVESITGENIQEVILEEGKIKIEGQDHSFSEILTPNERFSYDQQKQEWIKESADAKYLTSWKDDLLVFRNESLGEVMKQIGRWYNVKIETDPKVKEFRYRATFQDEPLEEVLRLISLTAPIKYEIKRDINKEGEYNKKIVIIKLK